MKTCCGSSVLTGLADEDEVGSEEVDQVTGGRRAVHTT
jgi:hypothetical protein